MDGQSSPFVPLKGVEAHTQPTEADAKTARPADGKLVVFFDIDNCL